MAATAPHYALEQAQDAAHGGEGWRSRQGTTADELGSIWAACGVASECGTLRSVLMHRPGEEIDGVADAASAATPATCGAAIEVPVRRPQVPPGTVLIMFTPGAAMSTVATP